MFEDTTSGSAARIKVLTDAVVAEWNALSCAEKVKRLRDAVGKGVQGAGANVAADSAR